MTFRVIILPQAQVDIERNADWWACHHSVEQSLRWVDVIFEQLDALKASPGRHALAAENDQFPYEIREKLVGAGSRPGYRAIFTIRNDSVYVLTVRAAEQDRLQAVDVNVDFD